MQYNVTLTAVTACQASNTAQCIKWHRKAPCVPAVSCQRLICTDLNGCCISSCTCYITQQPIRYTPDNNCVTPAACNNTHAAAGQPWCCSNIAILPHTPWQPLADDHPFLASITTHQPSTMIHLAIAPSINISGNQLDSQLRAVH